MPPPTCRHQPGKSWSGFGTHKAAPDRWSEDCKGRIAPKARKCDIGRMSKAKENLRAAQAKVVCERLGVSSDTLRRWAHRGLIKAIITAGGHYRYDLEEYLEVYAEAERAAEESR
jgi:excisionase family DNA binding protein